MHLQKYGLPGGATYIAMVQVHAQCHMCDHKVLGQIIGTGYGYSGMPAFVAHKCQIGYYVYPSQMLTLHIRELYITRLG